MIAFARRIWLRYLDRRIASQQRKLYAAGVALLASRCPHAWAHYIIVRSDLCRLREARERAKR